MKYSFHIFLIVLAITTFIHADSEGKQVLTVLKQLRANILKQSIGKSNCLADLKKLQSRLRVLEKRFATLGKRRDAAMKLYFSSIATLNALREQLEKAQKDLDAKNKKKRDAAQTALKLIDDIHAKLVNMGKRQTASETSTKCIELLLKIKANILAELQDEANDFQHLRDKIAQAEKDVAANKRALDDIQKEYEDVEKQIKAMRDEIAKFEEECKKRNTALERANKKKQKELALIDSVIDHVEKSFKESVGSVTNDASVTWQRVVQVLDKLILDLLKKKNALKDPRPACQQALSDLDAKLKALEDAVAKLRAELKDAKDKLKNKKKEVRALKLEVAKYSNMVQLKEAECNKMPSFFSLTVQDPRALEELKAILELIATVENLHNAKDISENSYKTIMAVLKKIKDALQKRVNRIEKENDAKVKCNKELAALKEKLNGLTTTLQEAQAAYKRLKSAINMLKANIATKKAEINALRVIRTSKKQSCDNDAKVYTKALKQLADLIEKLKIVKTQIPK